MEGKKLLVTGGLGYIGSHTVAVLMDAGFDIVIIDNLSNTHKEKVIPALTQITGKEISFFE